VLLKCYNPGTKPMKTGDTMGDAKNIQAWEQSRDDFRVIHELEWHSIFIDEAHVFKNLTEKHYSAIWKLNGKCHGILNWSR